MAPDGDGSHLTLVVEESHYRLRVGATVVMLLGGLGALILLLWPLMPALGAVAPLGTLLAVLAWMMVASRLRMAGPDEFLELVADAEGPEIEADPEPPAPPPAATRPR